MKRFGKHLFMSPFIGHNKCSLQCRLVQELWPHYIGLLVGCTTNIPAAAPVVERDAFRENKRSDFALALAAGARAGRRARRRKGRGRSEEGNGRRYSVWARNRSRGRERRRRSRREKTRELDDDEERAEKRKREYRRKKKIEGKSWESKSGI